MAMVQVTTIYKLLYIQKKNRLILVVLKPTLLGFASVLFSNNFSGLLSEFVSFVKNNK